MLHARGAVALIFAAEAVDAAKEGWGHRGGARDVLCKPQETGTLLCRKTVCERAFKACVQSMLGDSLWPSSGLRGCCHRLLLHRGPCPTVLGLEQEASRLTAQIAPWYFVRLGDTPTVMWRAQPIPGHALSHQRHNKQLRRTTVMFAAAFSMVVAQGCRVLWREENTGPRH